MRKDSKQSHAQKSKSAGRKNSKQRDAATKAITGKALAHRKKSAPKPPDANKSTNEPKNASRLCPYSNRCGGCSDVEVPYPQQLAHKQREMKELFASVAPSVEVSPILGMEQPFHYRDKVISPYAPGRLLKGTAARADITQSNARTRSNDRSNKDTKRSEGAKNGKTASREILTGMYERGTHRLIPATTCLVENETAKQVTLAIRDIMARWDMTPYNEDTGTGFVRHAVVRVGHESNEVLVTLVTNEEAFPASKSFCRELVRRVPAVTTVVQNINNRQTNVILGENERVLYGPGFILDTLCGLSFRISSKSFYQVNCTQTEVLYNTAMEMAQLGPDTWAIDAYCGTGTIGLVAAARGAARVIGVDSVESAIADARQNARHNGIDNAEFFTADATAFMEQLARDGGLGTISGQAAPLASTTLAADIGPAELVIFMDPPRAGSTPQFISAASQLRPARIVYISCNPATQVRDLEEFAKHGYRATRIQPVDMFPHTPHTETVAVLSRKSATKTFIPVTVSPKDMGLDEAKAQPTYENIRKYVKETHGLTVSTLNIAQMKAECGLEMECDRSGGKQQPKCPPEKREAILDAFRHFGMIEDDSSEG